MAAIRRLSAILAADVAGYSRLMGVDEEGTHERLTAHLVELVDPKIEEHHGRTVKNTGDGVLAEFPSVVDAVRCAVEVQRGMINREPELPEERRIRFRIGVNLGDVIVQEHDIFGDGVNVAARLEALADPGGICVSRMVRDQIRDKLPYPFDDLGEQSVKNIPRPVRAYALRPEGLSAQSRPRLLASRRRWPLVGATAAMALVILCLAWWFLAGGDLSSRSRKAGRPSDCLCNADGHGSGRHRNLAALPRAAPVDRRIAVRQSQQRPRPTIFRRRDHRGSDDRSVAARGDVCDLAQYLVHIQEQAARYEANRPRVGRTLCA
jgi:class 3 adenylate cyclase